MPCNYTCISSGDDLNADFKNREDDWETRHQRMQEAEKYKSLGNESVKRGFLESAIEYYSKAIKLNPDKFEYYTNRALCYKKQGKWKEVANDVRTALNLDADSVKAHYYLGQALIQLGEPEEGLKKLTKAKTLSEHFKVPYIDEIEDEILKAKRNIWLMQDAEFTQNVFNLKDYVEVRKYAITPKHCRVPSHVISTPGLCQMKNIANAYRNISLFSMH
uniref:RING-type E3 ubiquitin transferase n=1 Tax=Babesia bovis TaxID=5865 RepID=S6B6D8_BABBO|nr:tetratricopeptide repeat (TPR)-/ U-box domain-containing protein [Babesia bovis]